MADTDDEKMKQLLAQQDQHDPADADKSDDDISGIEIEKDND